MNFDTFAQHPVFYFWLFIFQNAIWWYPALVVLMIPKLYLRWVRASWLSNLKWFMIEIKFPKEILKSPKAMEIVLSAMHQPSVGSLVDQYIKGRVHSVFSLEMASFGGDVHFYIRGEAKFKGLIESTIYSQYPGVEIYEVEDYAYKVPYTSGPESSWEIFGIEFGLTKEDVIPIKTYVDYGMDKDPKEEFKVDPLTAVLEFLGSLGPQDQVWIQIPVVASQQDIKAKVKKAVDEITGADKKKPDDKTNFGIFSMLPNDREKIEAIQRAAGKYCFDVGYRMIYLAPKDNFNGTNIGRMISSVKQYGSEHLNGIKMVYFTSFDYPWQDVNGMRLAYRKRQIMEMYRRRAYFYPPADSKKFILSSEELATIYHFPGQVATTPTLDRVASKRGEPPANLPI
jgi:hypothetical protein